MVIKRERDFMKKLVIAIDFDGTCVTHDYPEIGKDIGAIPVLKRLIENGHKLILYTMRSGEHLEAAKKWFEDAGIPLYGVNCNPTQKRWTNSPKIFANLYIDDAALGAPLKLGRHSEEVYIDWFAVEKLLEQYSLI